MVSLAINFSPSAKGCNKPYNPTTLGPRRRCIAARTLRSYKVKKATDKIIGKIIGKNFNQSKSKRHINKTNIYFKKPNIN